MILIEEKIEKLAEIILESSNIVALTGAGMSTESGIADFRTPGTGLWEKVDYVFKLWIYLVMDNVTRREN
jgi:NAD-dependent SIR2 family protein deacetylase